LSLKHYLALLALPLPALAAEADGRLSGVVFFANSGSPVAGVVLQVGDHVVRTGDDGSFQLSLPPGEYPVQVQGPDGLWKPTRPVRIVQGLDSEILITWDPGADALLAQIEAPDPSRSASSESIEGPAGYVRGIVRRADDQSGLQGVRVFVRGLAVEALTNDKGRFELELPQGVWELSFVAPAFASQNVPSVGVDGGDVTTVEVDLVPSGVALEDFTVRAPRITGGAAVAWHCRNRCQCSFRGSAGYCPGWR